jgi:hypothetical protein
LAAHPVDDVGAEAFFFGKYIGDDTRLGVFFCPEYDAFCFYQHKEKMLRLLLDGQTGCL